MVQNILLGSGLAFAAAVQPGPLQTFLFARVAVAGWRRTLPAALSPLLSDWLVAAVVLLAIGRLPAPVQHLLRSAGGVLLVYLAWAAIDGSRSGRAAGPEAGRSAPRTLLQAALVNLLNPSPYLGWALVIGPAVVTAWREAPTTAIAFLVAFYGTMVATLAALIVLFGATSLLGPKGRSALVRLAALLLAVIGLFQLWVGMVGVMTPAAGSGLIPDR